MDILFPSPDDFIKYFAKQEQKRRSGESTGEDIISHTVFFPSVPRAKHLNGTSRNKKANTKIAFMSGTPEK